MKGVNQIGGKEGDASAVLRTAGGPRMKEAVN